MPNGRPDKKVAKDGEEDDFEDYEPSPDDDGITPLSKINSTMITIADILRQNEKLLVGKSTYTKKCDSMGHCFVAKCRHTEFDDSRRRYCTIYKNLSLPG